jgi:hypothetical protein
MIFTSLGLLVVAAGFLIAGIAKSSVALLTLSVVITIAAGAMLVLVSAAAKRLPGATPAAGPTPAFAGMPAGGMPNQPVVMYVPMQAAPMQATTVMPTVVPGDGNGNGATPPVVGYDTMTAAQITKLVGSGALTQDQLLSLQEYEQTHAARKTVLEGLEAQLG